MDQRKTEPNGGWTLMDPTRLLKFALMLCSKRGLTSSEVENYRDFSVAMAILAEINRVAMTAFQLV